MNKTKVNLIAGSGTHQGPGSWIFSDMIEILTMGIDASRFELTITPTIDETKKYDVYHYFHSTLAVLEQCKMHHRSLVTIHAMSDLAPNWSFEYKEQSLRKARKVSSVSTTIIDTLISRGIDKNKIFYTPAGVDLNRFVPTKLNEKEGLCKKSQVDFGPTRFGIVSRRYDDGRKGEEFLGEIIKEHNDSKAFRFMFVGVNWEKYLSEITNKYNLDPNLIEYFERGNDCQYSDYSDLYGTMDAILVTSKADAGPICILEALAKGLPIISTPTGLANELLVKRVNDQIIGIIVAYGDVYGFVDAMNTIGFNDSDTYKNDIRQVLINPNGYSPIKTECKYDYSWDSFCKRFEDIYQEIADECKNKVFLEDFMSENTQNEHLSFYANQAKNSLTNIYLDNFMQIKPYAAKGVGITNYQNVLEGQSAVIIGAGPSLDKDIDILEKYQDRINIFACDAVLPVLNQRGIKPDVVIVADPTDRQVKNFTGCSGKEFMTIMPTVVHPMTFNEARKYDCIVSWYNIADSNIELCKWIPKEVGYKGLIRPAVLTSGMVFQIVLYMGCKNVTFIGHDLSWPELNKGYASGISEEKIMYQRNSKMFNNPVFLFHDVNGNVITTDFNFIIFIQWINTFLKEFNIQVFNSTGSGILYGENITQIPLKEWCLEYQLKEEKEIFPMLYHIYKSVKFGNDVPILPQKQVN